MKHAAVVQRSRMGACRAPDPGSNPGRGVVGDTPKTPNANYDELKGVIAKDLESTVDNNLQISASDLIKFELALRQGNISEERIKKCLS